MAEKPDLTYVNSSNVKIYFGGILIDDIYDLQYAYRETKEPIYGYNSKYFDHLAGGNVIIHGSFTINYRHDKYLFHVLNKLGFTGSSVSSSTARMARIKELNDKYLKILRDYRTAQKDDKKLKDRVKQQEEAEKAAKAVSELNKRKYSEMLEDANREYENKWMDYNDKLVNLSIEDRKVYENYLETDKQFQLLKTQQDQAIKEANNSLAKIKQMQDDLVLEEYPGQYNEAISDAEMKIASAKEQYIQTQKDYTAYVMQLFDDYPNIGNLEEAKLGYQVSQLDLENQKSETEDVKALADETVVNAEEDTKRVKQEFTDHQQKKKTLLEELEKVRKQLNDEQGSWSDLKELEANGKNIKRRPEDMPAFTIFINVNGMNHIVLEDVSIIGESLPIVVGGEAVKESYSFIARKIR